MSGWLLGLDGNAGLHGWQWLFLVQGLPTVLFGLVVLRYLPDAPATATWLTLAEKDWIHNELAREQARKGAPLGHNVLAAFRNPRVLLLGAIGFTLIAVITTVILNAPLILQGATALDAKSIGYVVAVGGISGALATLALGNHADRYGDRWGNAFWCGIVLAGAVLVMGLSPSPMLTIIAYFAFATICFTIPMLTSSGWAEVLHVRELAVGAAAINTISQIGAFVAPYGWGAAKDATGSFQPALIGLSLVALLMSALILLLRHQVRGKAARSVMVAA
jgi:ACS family tartrate transporter-like MFS transporter